MALNFCVICDKGFSETKKNPGDICPDCCDELKAKKKLEADEASKKFENYLFERASRDNEFV